MKEDEDSDEQEDGIGYSSSSPGRRKRPGVAVAVKESIRENSRISASDEVKTPEAGYTAEQLETFRRELDAFGRLAEIARGGSQHPNILAYHGCSVGSERLVLVLEYVDGKIMLVEVC